MDGVTHAAGTVVRDMSYNSIAISSGHGKFISGAVGITHRSAQATGNMQLSTSAELNQCRIIRDAGGVSFDAGSTQGAYR